MVKHILRFSSIVLPVIYITSNITYQKAMPPTVARKSKYDVII